MNLAQILGIELPVIQAPMAGVQAGALAAAVIGAGALGSLPAALLAERFNFITDHADKGRNRELLLAETGKLTERFLGA